MTNNIMKRIILTSLFFCLAITTVLAQVVTTNIATPVMGFLTIKLSALMSTQTALFKINSASDGTATLGIQRLLPILISQQVAKQILFYYK